MSDEEEQQALTVHLRTSGDWGDWHFRLNHDSGLFKSQLQVCSLCFHVPNMQKSRLTETNNREAVILLLNIVYIYKRLWRLWK